MAGRPLSCDEQTYNCTRLDYARVCVEVDATLPFIHHFEMESSLSEDQYRSKLSTSGDLLDVKNVENLQKPTTVDEHRVILYATGAPSSNKDNDPQPLEENQHLITGFPPCIESRIVTFPSCSEASTSAKDTSLGYFIDSKRNKIAPARMDSVNIWPFPSLLEVSLQCQCSHQLPNLSGLGSLAWNYISIKPRYFPHLHGALLGDFNAILRTTDRSGGDASWYGHMEDFGCCINDSELSHISYSGMKFTWHNGQLGNSAIMKKLDWIFGNSSFLNSWPAAHSQFLPRDHSDHSSMVLTLSTPLPHSPAPFKFLNVWADREDFLDIVKSVWESPIRGTPIYRFTAKLRLLKHSLKTLHRHHTSHISSRVAEAKQKWTSTQILLDESPASVDLLAAERQSRNNIHALNDEAGIQVADQKGIGQMKKSRWPYSLSPIIKAPGPDGFTALFFKRCWNIIGVEFIAAIKHCFRRSNIPCCVNATRIALVPKSTSKKLSTLSAGIISDGLKAVGIPECMRATSGDPLSPYLFVLAMEGLGDDVMIFCNADLGSVQLIREALASFSRISGLAINHNKSSVFLSGVEMGLRNEIINCLGFNMGTLPIKNWTTASLTYAGRLQLIKSTLFSIQVYWSSMFLLPCHIIRKIESILAAFLWKGTSLNHAGAKVAWASLCYPLKEGGLGIKSIRTWNNAAVLKHVWRLLTESSSVWVEWVHSSLLRGRCFWHINPPSTSSWSWRKILLSRTKCKGMFTSCIGNGKSTSLWLDYWLPDARRICDILPFRVLTSTGLPWNAKVSDIISDGRWTFPSGHHDLQTIWNSIHFHPRTHLADHCKWQGHPSGKFTIDSAWNFLRDSRPTDTIYHLIWFPEHIPRQAFILWIASMGRLHTMDRLLSSKSSPLQHAFYVACIWKHTITYSSNTSSKAFGSSPNLEFSAVLFPGYASSDMNFLGLLFKNRIAVGKGSANGRERVGSPDMERVEVGSNVSCMVQLTALEFLPAWPCSREAPTNEAKFFCFFAWGLSPRLAAVGMGPVAQET
ncbi:hypothetical protein NC652_024398 [Populus alba x Populus x berolinensis]|nr:hypothetical protein NC652_024398 [Populus alba x Populus x berolinensis]